MLKKPAFDIVAFLAHAGLGRRIVQLPPGQSIFSQGDPADSVFYLQKGRAKITVVSHAGKEATITILSADDFVGEESLADTLIPKISQETLAEMIGTTRSRVSFFMNRFRKLGFIDYSDRIRVHKSLLNLVLHDHLPNDNTEKMRVLGAPLEMMDYVA